MDSGRSISSSRSREAHVIKGKEATFLSQECLGQDLSPRAQSQGRRHTGGDGTAALHTSLPTGSLWQLHCCLWGLFVFLCSVVILAWNDDLGFFFSFLLYKAKIFGADFESSPEVD